MKAAGFVERVKAIDWTRPSLVALVLANLVPVFGVMFLGWKVFPLLLLFWFENLIIVAFTAFKMLLASPEQPAAWVSKILSIPFFCCAYASFSIIHGILLLTLFGVSWQDFDFVAQVLKEQHLGWAILGLVVSHGVSFVTNYLGRGEYRRANLQVLMRQPFARVGAITTLTILFGGVLMVALKSPVLGLLVLVGLKLALDVYAHDSERRQFAPAQVVVTAVPAPVSSPTLSS